MDLLNLNVDFRVTVEAGFAGARAVQSKRDLYAYLNTMVLTESPIDYLEFGVYKGESLRVWASSNLHRESRFYGFDTFEGLPERWRKGKDHGAFDVGGTPPDIEDERIEFVKGLFQRTLRPFLGSHQLSRTTVVHIDCDIYSAALFCLATLDPCLPAGSLIIFDEFYDLENEFLAMRDYARSFYRQWEGLAFTPSYAQVAVRLAN